ncbi:MAG TPA: hemolysin III family protein [bacterium]|nr:hemolysin III family protein [bacterium]
MTTPTGSEGLKPRLRGVLHQWAAVVAGGAGAVLMALAPTARALEGAASFVGSLLTLLTVSAVYHRRNWQPRAREWMRRADHSAIFVLIAGTYSALALLALPRELGSRMLLMVWIAAAVGIIVSMFWVRAPKLLIAGLYLAMGWIAIPYFGEIRHAFSPAGFALLLGGGIAYSIGALAYAFRRPNPVPGVFGYHEVFHALTIVAGALHFTLVAQLVRAAP